VAIVALGISILTYTQVQSMRTGDHSAAEAVEKLRQDIATDLAQKRVAAGEQAQALQQGLAQDLKKLQEVSNLKPLSGDEWRRCFPLQLRLQRVKSNERNNAIAEFRKCGAEAA